MEGYRASLIICMPEFDTYHALERFARNNSDQAAIQAYRFLKKRTELAIRWQALRELDHMDLQKAVEIYTGVNTASANIDKLEDMTEEQRMSLFEHACKETGIQIDPSLFRNM